MHKIRGTGNKSEVRHCLLPVFMSEWQPGKTHDAQGALAGVSCNMYMQKCQSHISLKQLNPAEAVKPYGSIQNLRRHSPGVQVAVDHVPSVPQSAWQLMLYTLARS
jgi:hypothetical protein